MIACCLLFFFEDDSGATVTVNTERYQQVIKDHIKPHLTQRRMLRKTWMQQDGAPPHTSATKTTMKSVFQERVISKGFNLEWPPRSPGLNPCDCWLWGYLKANVYTPSPTSLNELKQKIYRRALVTFRLKCFEQLVNLSPCDFNTVSKNKAITSIQNITEQCIYIWILICFL